MVDTSLTSSQFSKKSNQAIVQVHHPLGDEEMFAKALIKPGIQQSMAAICNQMKISRDTKHEKKYWGKVQDISVNFTMKKIFVTRK